MSRSVVIGTVLVAAGIGAAASRLLPANPAQAQSSGFHAVSLSAAGSSNNVSYAWIIGQDGSVRLCTGGQALSRPTCATVPF